MPAISETSEIIKNNSNHLTRTAGATVARSTPDRKVIRSNRVWFNTATHLCFFYLLNPRGKKNFLYFLFPRNLKIIFLSSNFGVLAR
jgi:hypothetical protein